MYIIGQNKCEHCGDCLAECPMNAISQDSAGDYHIDPDICTDCGACADICPQDAISGA